MSIKYDKIPTGHYCYGYLPAHNCGFWNLAQVDAYLSTLPKEKLYEEDRRLRKQVFCPYWRPIGHGRVRCKLTRRVAEIWSRRCEHQAAIFYRKHSKALKRETGFLIGDAVKECGINREGMDFAFPSDPRQPGKKQA